MISSGCWRLSIPLLLLSGCAGPDVYIRNPIRAGAVDGHRIVKEHGYIEQNRGLPPGSVADEAVLLSADPQQACFGVSLHEMGPIDLQGVQVRLSSRTGSSEQAQVWPEQPTAATYDGLIPTRQQRGFESYCAARTSRGLCLSWRTRPLYVTVYHRGPVSVFATRGRLCFPNQGIVTPGSDRLALWLRLSIQNEVWGNSTKEVEFRWGFVDAVAK